MSITAKIDRVTLIPDSHRFAVCPPPMSCKIELTAKCNYRCSFCVKSIRPDNREMDRKLFSRVIREMKAFGVEELGVFLIGESMTCKWLPEAIAEARSVGFEYVFLTTNGSLATPQLVEELMEAGLNSLKFSINFDSKEQFKSVAQVKPRLYEDAIKNLKMAKFIRDTGGFATKIYASSIAFDGEQGERMKKIVADIEPFTDEFYWLPLFAMSGAAEQNKVGKASKGNPGRLGAMRDVSNGCWSCFTEAHISATGKLAACCFGLGIDDSMVMADLNEVDFATGWNSVAFQNLRQAHLDGDVSQTPCAECVAS